MIKRLILTYAIGTALLACKKNDNPDFPAANENRIETTAAVETQDELIKNAQSKPLTNLTLSENHFDFGKIKKGDQVDHVYEVTNVGKNPLVISTVKPGCGCTVPDFTKDPILPGKKGKITLKFDSTHFDGLVHKQAEVYANVEKTPITITFSADIQP